MKKRLLVFTLALFTCLLFVLPSASFAANPVMTADLGSSTGAPLHGATGFLYGLADNSTPSDSNLTGLNSLDMTGQMAPGGLQHSGGDAFVVADKWFRTGGKYVQIYMQDIYAQWPYPNTFSDYLNKVTTIANQVKNNANRTKFLYVPFNEPDWIWYGNSGTKLTNFQNDWKTVFQLIRSIDPSAKIVGPNFEHYNSAAYRSFFTFAKANNVLPDYTSWHELDDTTSTWYYSYNDYRSIENSLGISARPITINEYGKSTELGNPGKMTQYMARFENSKVHAGLAYWFMEGQLDELLTPSQTRSGAWYLYQWYGGFSGNTINVTPPSENGAMQGLGYYDSGKKLSAVIFGGGSGSLDFNLTRIPSALQTSGVTKVEVWGVDNSNKTTSSGTYLISSNNYTVSGGSVQLTVNNLNANSAYQLVIKPGDGSGGSGGSWDPNTYYKIIARHSGKALDVSGGSTADGGDVIQWTTSGNANQQWKIESVGSGYYKITNRNSGKVLDVYQASTADGGDVVQWTASGSSGSSNQQWSIEQVGSYYKIVNRNSGKALDVYQASTADGANVVQWMTSSSPATNQQWTITP
ncbi:hypothetical protein D7Z26_04940 [Cohnella endophytica]|uniref:Ricin B lectin domain-containing protein n=1 Tax=Cohnella endophytica TaxID=2419778 RepID=A0A494Y3Q0_9BACL|nr:RICIN domain-containing protein [Cohnella endophytica]RKP57324.1 hypothetical protein D7Z26_04940 [Cohnella endophytica]